MKRATAVIMWVLLTAGCAVNPAERNNAGNALYEQQDFVSAIRAYHAAMVAAPDQPEPYYNAALALSRSGRQQGALEALEQALKTADDDLRQRIYYSIGNVHFLNSDFETAISAYREALRLNSDDADARFNYELALRRMPTATPTSTPEGNAQTSTPTSSPVADEVPLTPTPTPGQDDSDGGRTPTPWTQSPTPAPGQDTGNVTPTATVDVSGSSTDALPRATQGGALSPEDAARSLDAVQQNQRTLREFLNSRMTPSPPVSKDW